MSAGPSSASGHRSFSGLGNPAHTSGPTGTSSSAHRSFSGGAASASAGTGTGSGASATGSVRKRPWGGQKIRAPKAQAANNHDETWEKLAKAIGEIQNHNASKLSFEEHYRYAYTLVLHKKGDYLYDGVKSLVARHLDKKVASILGQYFPSHYAQALDLVNADQAKSSTSGSVKGKEKERVLPNGRTVSSSSASTIRRPAAGTSGGPSSAAVSVPLTTTEAAPEPSLREGETFLGDTRAMWEDHVACMSKLRDVLKYLDKSYLPKEHLVPIWDSGLNIFVSHVIRSRLLPISDFLIRTLLSQIRLEREGEVVNRSCLRSNMEMLSQLLNTPRTTDAKPTGAEARSVYAVQFEGRFLEETKTFYEKEAERLLEGCDCPEYLRRVESRLGQEDDRTTHYLNRSTESSLRLVLEEVFIAERMDPILSHSSTGLDVMITDNRFSDLRRLYRLFGRVPTGHEVLKRNLQNWVIETGKKINDGLVEVGDEEGEGEEAEEGAKAKKGKGKGKEKEGDSMKEGAKEKPQVGGVVAATMTALQWVQNVLDLKDKCDKLWVEAFKGDKAFQTSLNDAFTSFINMNGKAPEFVSLFVDDNLKKGIRGKTDQEVDAVLEKTTLLFRFLSDKDVFERYYKRHLGKRLVAQRSVSDDAERNMLAKLKVESGALFVKDLEGMLKDVKISADLAGAYKSHLGKPGSLRPPFDLSVLVCTSSMWHFNKAPATAPMCTLPPFMVSATTAFQHFYHNRHTGRKLTWQTDLGTVDVRIAFKARKHDVTLSTHAMVVLALFGNLDDGEHLSFAEIQVGTAIAEPELKRTLQSLACAKYRILTKDPKGRDVDATDRFSFNSNFKCPLAKIKIQTVSNRVESNSERKDTNDKVEEERRLYTEACIVRTLKARKAMMHSDLVHEVTRQLGARFRPQPSTIKQAIEKLIEKEYLERDEKDRKQLRYLA